MQTELLLSLSTLAALAPVALLTLRPGAHRDAAFWSLLAVALAASVLRADLALAPEWHTSLSGALWITMATSIALFAIIAAATRDAWRLTPLLMPYLILLGAVATFWQQAPERPLVPAPAVWLDLHILVSVATYGLLTIAAIAGFAVLIQERSLKNKRRGRINQLLPSIALCETLQVRLLAASEIILAIGVSTGMATQYFVSGRILAFDHKTLLSLLTFVVIGALLILLRGRSGLGGRRAAHFVLLAYLLLTLAYPGVKFVTDVLLA
ncbi:MAG TPA: cytochrome c biogenesis protein CcsA [Alphaproteobacteria bacterium]|nr:cytochrome c biogenesis protein CcsA [Alphaproteobacteria bacterium]